MKLRNLYAILLLLFVCVCNANSDSLILFSYHNKYGYANEKMEVVIEPRFIFAEQFSPIGFAAVRENEKKCEIIDTTGKVIFETEADNLSYLVDDCYSLSRNTGNNSIIRIKDHSVIASGLRSRGYTGTDPFILVGHLDDPQYLNYMDLEGNVILPDLKIRKYSYPFYEGMAIISRDNWEYAIIDLKGNDVLKIKLKRIGQHFSEGLIPAQDVDGVTGYINTTGVFQFTLPFSVGDAPDATNFHDGYAMVKNKEAPKTWTLINKSGEIQCQVKGISSAKDFYNGFSKVSQYDEKTRTYKYGYIDTKGKYFVPIVLDNCESFNDGYARIMYKGRDGLLDPNGYIFWSDALLAGKIKGEKAFW